MSCCGLFSSCDGKCNENEQYNVDGRHIKTPKKLSGCLRKHCSRSAQRLSSLFTMPKLGAKKASYFSAALSDGRFPMDGEAEMEPIPFDKVLSEFPKNVYDPTRGVFTCPKSGAYMFTFSMRPDAPNAPSLNVQLMKEEEPQVSLYANSGHYAGTSSQSCILDVKQGEKVWVRLNHGALRNDMRCPNATFNGTLLRQIKKM